MSLCTKTKNSLAKLESDKLHTSTVDELLTGPDAEDVRNGMVYLRRGIDDESIFLAMVRHYGSLTQNKHIFELIGKLDIPASKMRAAGRNWAEFKRNLPRLLAEHFSSTEELLEKTAKLHHGLRRKILDAWESNDFISDAFVSIKMAGTPDGIMPFIHISDANVTGYMYDGLRAWDPDIGIPRNKWLFDDAIDTSYEMTPHPEFPDRPGSVEGWIERKYTPRSEAAEEAQRIAREGAPREGLDASHLIADRFDGPPHKYNLVMADSRINRSYMSYVESYMDWYLRRLDNVYVKVDVIDYTPDGLPNRMRYRMYRQLEDGSPDKIFDVEFSDCATQPVVTKKWMSENGHWAIQPDNTPH